MLRILKSSLVKFQTLGETSMIYAEAVMFVGLLYVMVLAADM